MAIAVIDPGEVSRELAEALGSRGHDMRAIADPSELSSLTERHLLLAAVCADTSIEAALATVAATADRCPGVPLILCAQGRPSAEALTTALRFGVVGVVDTMAPAEVQVASCVDALDRVARLQAWRARGPAAAGGAPPAAPPPRAPRRK
jgi:hypothetical protein